MPHIPRLRILRAPLAVQTELVTARRALITGATGYIGSQLVNRLIADGWEVHIIVRAASDLTVLDCTAPDLRIHAHDGTAATMNDLVGQARPDVVFHLASLFLVQHQPDDVAKLVESNILFSTQLVEAMMHHGIAYLVNTGTSWQHHGNEAYRPVNLYAATKQAFESILAYYCDASPLKATTLALFDTYGPNDPRKKLIALLWQTAATQQPLLLSPGEQMLDMVHIDDVLDAFVQAADILPNQVSQHVRYGVSSGAPMRLIDLVAEFERATGTVLPIVWGGREYRPREVMIPWNLHTTVPGWTPRIPFEQGILQTRAAS